jgi:hypothetical protein
MKSLKFLISVLLVPILLILLNCCMGKNGEKGKNHGDKKDNFYIGWSIADITPDRPVIVSGQMNLRISEGVLDSISATALALESGTGPSSKKAILISCDLIGISDGLRDNVRNLLKESLPELSPEQVFLNATHTHTAPACNSENDIKSSYGIEIDALTPSECEKYIAERVAKAAEQAWKNRKPGGISFGLGQAVVGHNRIQTDFSGKSTMYGNTNKAEFSHIEGYEDHSVNLLYTWDKKGKLTGVVINIACPSQVTEDLYKISADYWHETRMELSKRLGKGIYILPQCSAAGDQSPHILVGAKAEERMRRLMLPDSVETGRKSIGQRIQIAQRISDAVTSVLPYMKNSIEWNPVFDHKSEVVNLPNRNRIGRGSVPKPTDVKNSLKEAEKLKKQYEQLLLEIKENPKIMEKPRWYAKVAQVYSNMRRAFRAAGRNDSARPRPDNPVGEQSKMPVEVHVLRLGDMVIATNPFELYLDYGIRIKACSPAVQTFIVQLTGDDIYLPTTRSDAGGAYGSANTRIGPEGGQELVEKTLELINNVW